MTTATATATGDFNSDSDNNDRDRSLPDNTKQILMSDMGLTEDEAENAIDDFQAGYF